jgi:UDP-hydrolysing UDP-N-acetyl-D-glucosamine 2-epimerase
MEGGVRVAVVLTARPSWAKLQPVCAALQDEGVDVQVIACASALLERYGRVVDVVRAQGYDVADELFTTHEGENLVTSAKETGALLSELSPALKRLNPDAVVVCADRHEVLAAAQAAAYLHLPLVHLQGGEVTGSIDDKVRNAITQLADLHCVATQKARSRVVRMVGDADSVIWTGCPSIDQAMQARYTDPVTLEELGGSGHAVDLSKPFAVVLQHPVTSEQDAYGQMWTTLEAVKQVNLPRIVFWPGQDAGAAGMSKAIRTWIDQNPSEVVHTVRSLPPQRFLRLLTQAAVLVGNSSAGIRESAYLGVPVVNIGTRQQGRERAENVRDVPHELLRIVHAIRGQLRHGRYPSSDRYGAGDAGIRTAKAIYRVRQSGEKRTMACTAMSMN